jgi:hypothetical protein
MKSQDRSERRIFMLGPDRSFGRGMDWNKTIEGQT